jgi:hypothetical protein
MDRETLIDLNGTAVELIHSSVTLVQWLTKHWDLSLDRDFPTQDMYDRGMLTNLAMIEWAGRNWADTFDDAKLFLADRRGPRRLFGDWCTSVHEAVFEVIPFLIYDRLDELIMQSPPHTNFNKRYPLEADGRRPERLIDDLRSALATEREEASGSALLAEVAGTDITELLAFLDVETARALDHLPVPVAQVMNGTPATPAADAGRQPAAVMNTNGQVPARLIDDRRYSPAELTDLLRCSSDTLNRYAKAVGIATPAPGERSFTYSRDERDRILTHAEQHAGSRDTKRRAREALAELRNKPA